LSDQARDDVGSATGAKPFNHVHRPRRIALRVSELGDRRERGSASGQLQKPTARKVHCTLPGTATDLDVRPLMLSAECKAIIVKSNT
jgi:hypothetical protein